MTRLPGGALTAAAEEPVPAPLIVRIAGLPLGTMRRFRSSRMAAAIARDAELRAALDDARARMVKRLFAAIEGAPRDRRRFLLQVKRDCFNGRSLAALRASPGWPVLNDLAGSLATRILGLEEELARHRDGCGTIYRQERDRQRRALSEEIGSPGFRRGLALASPTVSRNLHRFRAGDPAGDERRSRRLETTLLRYLSRAALKLSPFSTFTRVGLGTVTGEIDGRPLALVGSRWRERSLLRIKRYLLDQYAEALKLYAPFRRSLVTVLNDSIMVRAGRYVFLQPSHWKLNRTSGELTYHRATLVRVKLEGPLVEWLLAEVPGEVRWTYGQLADRAAQEVAGTASDLDALIEIGFLRLLMPWCTDVGYLERAMLQHLRTLPRADELEAFKDRLGELLALEEGYARSVSPERSAEGIRQAIDQGWRAAGKLVTFASEEPIGQPSEFNFYEDVFLEAPDRGKGTREILRMSRGEAAAALKSMRPILILSSLFDSRHDFVHTAAAFACERWPGVTRVNVLELFAELQPLWREYTEFRLASMRRHDGWRTLFNPRGLAVLEELERHRDRVWAGIASCLEREAGCVRISIGALEEALGGVPGRYRPVTGSSLFLQPSDPRGGLWVLNRIKEGTGRFASRFTPVMPPDVRRRFTAALSRRAGFKVEGEPADLLDVLCIQGDTANVHAPQTPRVLEMPGERSGLPPGRRLSLGNLFVRIDPRGPWAWLDDDAGRRQLPVHLGLGHESYMPPLVRFLCLFGPSELSAVFPPTPTLSEEGGERRERLVIGNVVLLREAWSLRVGRLRAELGPLSGAEAFLAINRWRVARGLPERVFLVEDLSEEDARDHYRPQYLDFSSPLFVSLLESAIRTAGESLTFEEMLPGAGMFPRDEAGERWAVEVLVDSIATGC